MKVLTRNDLAYFNVITRKGIYAKKIDTRILNDSSPPSCRERQAYSFALVDLMDMEDNCESELTYQSNCHP